MKRRNTDELVKRPKKKQPIDCIIEQEKRSPFINARKNSQARRNSQKRSPTPVPKAAPSVLPLIKPKQTALFVDYDGAEWCNENTDKKKKKKKA